MKIRITIGAIVLMALQLFFLSSCDSSTSLTHLETETPSSTPSPLPSATATMTFTPSPTPTPIPVSIKDAILRGTFAEIEVYNKGQIAFSAFSPDGTQFVAFTKRGMYVYYVNSWQELSFTSLSPEVYITSISYSMDGSLFAAGDSKGIITFWDTKTWDVQNSFQVHKGAITSLDISPDNTNFVTIGDQKEISLWNMSDGSLIKSQFRSKDAGPASYSPDGKWLYISEETLYRDLIVWESKELKLINRLGQLGKRPPFQAVSPYTNTVAVFGYDTVIIYDFDLKETTEVALENYPHSTEFMGSPNLIFNMMNPNEKTFMLFLDEKTLMVKVKDSNSYHLIDVETHEITSLSLDALRERTFKNTELLHILKSDEIKALGFERLENIQNITQDGTHLILSGSDEVPSVVFNVNQKTMKMYTIQEFPWRDAVFLSDGTLAGVSWSRPIRVPPFSNKKQQGEFTITRLSPDSQFAVKSKVKQTYDLLDYIDAVTISPNGEVLAAGTADGNLYLWNLDTKELITTIRLHTKDVGMFGFYGAYWGLFFDEDGSHLATSGQDGKINVISMENLSEITSVTGDQPVFSPDGKNLAYVSSDGSIRLISILNEDTPKIFRGNINRINAISFSSDGTLLFSGDYKWDNLTYQSNLKVWSIRDETLLLDVPQSSIISLLVSPDGTRLYVHDGDGVLSAWGHQD